MLAEITTPVDLCLPSGALNPAAVGWTRAPLHRANLRQATDVRETLTDALGRAAMWSRTKRWEYWCVVTPTHVLTLTVSSLNYAGHHQVWLLDRTTGEEIDCTATAPLARDVRMPSRWGAGPVRARSGSVAIAIDPYPGDGPRPDVRIRAITPRLRVDLTVEVPAGHECLGVVVPWSERLFQYTVKDVALPVGGSIWLDEDEIQVDAAAPSWAVSDYGRGRWPYSVVWNWGAGSGVVDGVVTGLQLGGKWTDDTGSTENALVLDGQVHYLDEDLSWAYDVADRTAPWFVTGWRVQVRLQPFHERVASTNLGFVSSTTAQCFGTWTGWVVDDAGTRRRVDGLVGFAEEVANRW
ncbi:DUF2804 domain-containing protein [Georgenia subflava]|uniref:DUF2804 domain-containing protein n=1 Tax=Georgenia subflava TaxID=1622177 RepID=UPI001D02D7C8|nr:DUF2804 domain-containing protein [Georgenia subflava]